MSTASNTASTIESVLVENRVFPPDERASKGARISGMAAYEALRKEAETDPDGFWAQRARENLVHVLLNHNDFLTVR